jgi:F-type H+-transporting ATPase subunit b
MGAGRRTLLLAAAFACVFAGPGGTLLAAEFPSSFSDKVLDAGRVFNFVVVAFGLTYLLWAPLKKLFRSRTQEIQKQLAEAEAARIDALRKLNLMEERLLALNEEIREIKENAAADAAAESERILQQAEAEAARILARGGMEIETMKKQALGELRRFVADEAGRAAEEILRREITPQADDQLIDRFVVQMGGKR